MSIYAYKDSKIIDEVTFRKTANGALRAYVHACPDIGKGKVEEVLQAFKGADIEAIPFTVDNKAVVEVRGFKRESQLLGLLGKNNFISDTPEITKEPADHMSWGDVLRKRSIQASGVAMMVADTGYAIYGMKSKHWEDTLAGLMYLGGSINFTAFGKNDQSAFQIREGAQVILDHARAKGYNIPEDTALSTVGAVRKESALRKVHNFFEQHPSEIGNMAYVTAGALIAKSAMHHRVLSPPRAEMTPKEISDMRKGGIGDTVLGSTTITSGLIASLVKEKARDPDAPRQHGLSGIAEWIQEKPLRMASYGYIGSTLCHAYTTFTETMAAKRLIAKPNAPAKELALAKEHLGAIPYRVVFVAMSLIGEALLSISSKGHGEGVVSDNTVDTSIVAIAAELIIKQPKHMQEGLIQEMGKFLGQPEVLALKDEEAIKRLRHQVEEMRCNPWATKIPEAAPEAEKRKPAPVVVAKDAMPAWQAKVATVEKAPGATLALPLH